MADDTRKPWGEDFDEERAWKLIQGLRADKASLRVELADAQAEKTAIEKERDQAVADASAAKTELAADRRSAVLTEFGIDEADAEEFLPADLSIDELRRKAERLSGRKAKPSEPKDGTPEPKDGAPKAGDSEPKAGEPEPKDSAQAGASSDVEGSAGLPGRPTPKLVPGSGGGAESDLDLDAIAAAARRR